MEGGGGFFSCPCDGGGGGDLGLGASAAATVSMIYLEITGSRISLFFIFTSA